MLRFGQEPNLHSRSETNKPKFFGRTPNWSRIEVPLYNIHEKVVRHSNNSQNILCTYKHTKQ